MKGFTLVELLVSTLILGVLAAIALPSLLSTVNKSKEAEALHSIGVHSRAMQAYVLEHGRFPSNIEALNVEMGRTANYRMLLRTDSAGEGAVGAIIAETQNPKLHSFTTLLIVPEARTAEDRSNLQPKDFQTRLCESEKPGEKVRNYFVREIDRNRFGCRFLGGRWKDKDK